MSSKWRNMLALALLFGIELFTNAAESISGKRYFLIGWMGYLLILYTGGLLVWLGYEWRKGRPEKEPA